MEQSSVSRTAARELAFSLIYMTSVSESDPDSILESFFEDEYYETLSEELRLCVKKPDSIQLEYIKSLVSLCFINLETIDEHIRNNSGTWKPERISKTALAILRMCIAEMLYMEDVPVSAAINEAVEIAKSYENKETVSFINGVLGSVAKEIKASEAEETLVTDDGEHI
ncbi:MAG: transcription antitermination factor NusB [Ruminococcaceae bacterium]|nr:transcription antitermination factor NusB [Oscillospiraceae bacterium]